MQYLLLIYGEESPEGATTNQDAMDAEMAEYGAFNQHLGERGAFRAGEALFPSSAATTVRVRDGQTVTTDGPFAETKEVLGGYYVVEAADLDEAIGYAVRIPGVRRGSIEVRPVMDFGEYAASAIAQRAAAG